MPAKKKTPTIESEQKEINRLSNGIEELYKSVDTINADLQRYNDTIRELTSTITELANNPSIQNIDNPVSEPTEFKYSKTRNVQSPIRAHDNDAGVDFFIPADAFGGAQFFDLKVGERILIPSGIKMKVPAGYAMIFHNKSGVASKLGLLTGACVVDEGYCGEIHLNLFNPSNKITRLFVGQKIIQGIFIKMNYMKPVEVPIDKLFEETSKRGEKGFGSTGA